MTKTCLKCGRELPMDKFRRDPHSKGGRRARCKDCMRKQEQIELCDLTASDFANNVAADIVSPKTAAEICRGKLGWAPTASRIARAAQPSGCYPHLGELKLSKTGSRLILAGINRDRWLGLLNGRPWAKTAAELFGEGI